MHLMSYKTNVKNAHCAVSPKLAVVCDVYVNGKQSLILMSSRLLPLPCLPTVPVAVVDVNVNICECFCCR